jgi:outer membrane immunogenic protein
MLHRTILTAASVVALTAAASAADLGGYQGGQAAELGSYPGPAYASINWSGFYIGVNAGYGFDNSNIGSRLGTAIDPSLDLSPAGGFGGGQIGYNVQRANLVFGLETDIQGSGISDSKTLTAATSNALSASLNLKTSLDYFGTVRGRAGYAFDRTLVYATAGVAYGQITDGAGISAAWAGQTLGAASDSKSVDAMGYVVGAGVEHKFSTHWSAKAEYQYIDLGQDSVWAKATKEDFAVSTVRIGLNYRIGGES